MSGQTSFPELYDVLFDRFDLVELKLLFFYLDIDYENIAGEVKSDKIVGFLEYLQRHDCIDKVFNVGRDLRPDIDWAALAAGYQIMLQQRQEDTDRFKLLQKVKTFWINRVLFEFNSRSRLIHLTAKLDRSAIMQPWDDLIRFTSPGSIQLISAENVLDFYTRSGQKLLILGNPGSGKTVLLLQLAKSLIALAEQISDLPVPVILVLSSWADGCKPISEWVVQELRDKYQVPPVVGQQMVANHQVILLLDSLDEVETTAQGACVHCLNEFVQGNRTLGTVVCSRKTNYDAIGQKLCLNDALVLEPLDTAKKREYIAANSEKPDQVQGLLQQYAALNQLADSPLMLNLIVLNHTKLESQAQQSSLSIEDWRDILLKEYVDFMFERRGVHKKYDKSQTITYLSWLARKMLSFGSSMFLLEALQPAWLETLSERKRYHLLAQLIVGGFFGLVFGGAVGVAAGLLFGPQIGIPLGILFGFAWGIGGYLFMTGLFDTLQSLLVGLGFGISWGAAGWLASGPLYGAILGLSGVLAGYFGYGFGVRWLYQKHLKFSPDKIVPIEILGWSWKKAGQGFLMWLILGAFIGMGIGAVAWAVESSLHGWVYGVTSMLAFALTFGFAGGITAGEIEKKVEPNQGIRRSIRNSLLIGGVFAAMMFVVFSVAFGYLFGLGGGLLTGVAVGLAGALVGWTLFGGPTSVQHAVLRSILQRSGHIPSDYVEFLDYAAERIFLEKVGGGYMFYHRLLLEYFASIVIR